MIEIIIIAGLSFSSWLHGYYKGVQAAKRKTRELLGGKE